MNQSKSVSLYEYVGLDRIMKGDLCISQPKLTKSLPEVYGQGHQGVEKHPEKHSQVPL